MGAAECLFCRIASRQIPSEIVAETEALLAVKDIDPQAPVHLLIIPKEHLHSLADATPAHTTLMGDALHFANRLAREHRLIPSGYRVVINCGPQGGQSVWHLHVHVLGGRAMTWPPG